MAESENELALSPVPDVPITYNSPDQILTVLGPKNPYIILVWLSMGAVWGFSAMPMMESAFIMAECGVGVDRCGVVQNCSSEHNSTIFREFGLGPHSSIPLISTSLFYLGDTIGAISLTYLSDKTGRHWVLCLSLFTYGLIGCLSALSPTPIVFSLARFLQGIFFPGCGIINWVLAYESIPMSLRSYTALVFGLWWIIGYCLVGPLDAILANWRWLSFAVSVPSLVAGVIYFFTMPESFHFLTLRSNIPKLKIWIENANTYASCFGTPMLQKFNLVEYCKACNTHRKRFDPAKNDCPNVSQNRIRLRHQRNETGDINQQNSEEDAEKNASSLPLNAENSVSSTFIQDFCLKMLRRASICESAPLLLYTSIFAYLWTCDAFLYYGLSLFTSLLSGNHHLNYTLIGIVEIPAYLFSPVLLNMFGRKNFVRLCHFTVFVSFAIVVLNKVFFQCGELRWLTLGLWMIAKFAISSSFTSLFVYASEVFPTVSRNSRIGFCASVSRLGAMLVPLVRTMTYISDESPLIFFAIASSIAVIILHPLPETQNRNDLPDSESQIADLSDINSN